MQTEQLKQLLEAVQHGSVDIDTALDKLHHLPYEDLGFARIDHHRQVRRGFPETIFCQGKTTEQVVTIFESLASRGNNVLATRATQSMFDALIASGQCVEARYDTLGRTIVLEQTASNKSTHVLPIITAGTADLPVAHEALATARIMGQDARILCDVGVAGLHRLMAHLDEIQDAHVVIVVAGMEGALASVVGGLVSCPVIAVPTSVGYGASFGGLAALLSMLNSCASGVSVVNIDNGFSAAVSATLINRKIEDAS
ncbi:MAG: nickel pincer cofactor biosynthesis protein LarB [Planctomycetes bacterium]|nr:nickel pincer cofactor biosynthesis protein LarB [Planctomycetota bacterium]